MASAQAPPTETASEPSPPGIDVRPESGQTIFHEENEYTTIQEGLAYILVPRGIPTSTDPKMSKEETQRQQVFYNPIQQFNRDLSVLAIKTFGDDLVQRKQEIRERQRRKSHKMAEQKKRKLQKATNGDAPAETQELSDGDESPTKKRRTADNRDPAPSQRLQSGTSLPEIGVNETAASTSITSEKVPPPAEPDGRPTWKPSFTILDALSATGLRALRYAREIPSSTSITANDMSEKATASIALNVIHNKLDDKIQANKENAMVHMYSRAGTAGYDVIDLDPYGTAAPFIDAAIQGINDDGLLCVTCTDSAIFASHGYLEKTYSQYGGLPLKGEPCHEGGLRLVLHAIASSAARYGMAMEPLLSLSIDYYIRVFVKIRKAPADVKMLAGKTMIVYHCDSGCGSWTTQFLARNKPTQNKNGGTYHKHSFAAAPTANQVCDHCGLKAHLSGPMYGGPLHNVGFIERVLAQLKEVDRQTYPTLDRIEGMLHTALEEITFGVEREAASETKKPKKLDLAIPKTDPAEIDHHPFFIIPSAVARVLHCQAPPTAAVRGALRRAGYRTTMSHCKPGSIRTDAPWTAIWHVMLEWVRQKAPLKNALKAGTPGYAIMAKGSAHKVGKIEEGEAEATTKSATEEAGAHFSALEEVGRRLSQREERPETSQATSESVVSKTARPSYLGTDFEVVFDEALGRDHDRGKYVRYQLAPRENWGPMSRAK